VSTRWITEWGAPPHVSIAHKAGRAVALAAASESLAGVGIDIESVKEQPGSFVESAFSPSERALVATARDDERALAMTRIWCAKEAVGKALGWGLSEILGRLEAQHCGEVVRIALVGSSQAQTTNVGKTEAFEVATVQDGNFVIALVAIPAEE
jgi:phosphopantetheine--protein transferase-like protein